MAAGLKASDRLSRSADGVNLPRGGTPNEDRSFTPLPSPQRRAPGRKTKTLGLFVSSTASCLVIDVLWEENLAVSFPADSTRGDFRNGYGIFPPLIQIDNSADTFLFSAQGT